MWHLGATDLFTHLCIFLRFSRHLVGERDANTTVSPTHGKKKRNDVLPSIARYALSGEIMSLVADGGGEEKETVCYSPLLFLLPFCFHLNEQHTRV
jgi:hypothetical protein